MDKPPAPTLDTAERVGEGARNGWMVRPGPLFADRLQLLTLLRQRFREDRLGMTAGSLTFTTLIALVPLLTVTLALFTAFPMFRARWNVCFCRTSCLTRSRARCCRP
jgi:hypothetical protein